MYIRVVTFGLAGITAEQYARHAEAIAADFTAWPGLRAKFWLADGPGDRFGGVYLFDSKDDADRSRETPLFAGLLHNPALTGLTVDEYETLAAPTAVTAGADAEARGE
jgi:Putative mono-oxygenase ydhR